VAKGAPARGPEDRTRPRVAVVTRHWGDSGDEATAATRLVAGAVSRHADVSIVHLVSPLVPLETLRDSVFEVHRVPVHGARPLRSGILRVALAVHDGGLGVPATAASLLERYEGDAPEVPELLERLAPDAIVLAGHHQPYDIGVLGTRGRPGRARVVVLPYLGDERRLAAEPVCSLIEAADVVGVVHPGERPAVLAACPERSERDVVPLDLALSLNRNAASHRLFGVRWFGRYVLSIRDFPPGGARYVRSVTHEVLRSVVGRVSVAEVDGEQWRISDRENTLELPVSPSRVNLWRLMAHAVATIDLRPPGPFGRETIESMLLGTPVVVPDASAAMEHAAAADGGLWYRDVGELFDATRVLMYRPVRDRLAAQGRAYADAKHGQVDDFVARVGRIVLGDGVA